MQPVVTPSRAANLDKFMIESLGIPSIVLMEQAANALANEAEKLCPPGGKIAVICGKGNNGGDGFAAARILLTRGYDVWCGVVGGASTPDSEANALLLSRLNRLEALEDDSDFLARHSDACVIIDALFGTGLKRRPTGIYEKLINEINAHSAHVVAADIPSGVFGDNGQAETAVNADVTVTFQYPKPGHFIFPGREKTGVLKIAKIGVDNGLSPFDIFHVDALCLPSRKSNTNKGSFGKLSVIAGSKGMAGAAVLCARASIAAGSGLTRVGCTEYVAGVIQQSVPEATVEVLGQDAIEPEKALTFADGALAIGPGLGSGTHIADVLRLILPSELPKVVDADALNAISREKELLNIIKNAVITPHPKEFSRLSGMSVQEVLADPVKAASEFALGYNVTVLLKGATTVVADGAKTALITAGSPCMAKGGSGDVLTGVLGSFLAQGMGVFEGAYSAAYFCGKAGERAAAVMGDYSASPMDTIANLNLNGRKN